MPLLEMVNFGSDKTGFKGWTFISSVINMKILYILILTAMILAGCASTNPFNSVTVVPDRVYVVRHAPDVLRTLPPLPPGLANPRTATNSQVATWISDTESYVAALESQLQTIVNFYEAPVTTAEAGAMKAVMPTAPPVIDRNRVIQPQTTASAAQATGAAKATTAGAAPTLGRGQH